MVQFKIKYQPHLLVAVDQNNAKRSWHKTTSPGNSHIISLAHIINVHWN